MKALILKAGQFNALQPKNKEIVNTLRVCAVVKGEIQEVITARFYMSRASSASVVYCCLWIDSVASGRGQAGGYGYHKESAALQAAIASAGVELYGTPYLGGRQKTEERYNCETKKMETVKLDYEQRTYIGGCGDESMRSALIDIARDVLGYKKVTVL
jgi:hypothetical protein